jgi:hypothetical protein
MNLWSFFRMIGAGLCLLSVFVATLAALAHEDPNAAVPSVQALRVDAPLNVDGVLDEPFWAEAEVATDLIDDRSQQLQSLPTYIRIAYTQTHLYIAVECIDDNIAELRASERREDRSFVGDDWVEIHLDPTHTHRQKYAFFSNPLGTKADANEGPSGRFNYGWSAEWDCAATIKEDRWVFEMRIPFGIMNYYREDAQTWGFNVTRAIRRLDSTAFWSFNATETYKPRNFGHITGLDLADTHFDRNVEITPYVSTQVDVNDGTDATFQTGLDTSFRISSAITSSWTLNPDFGQVEADDDTIELRDTERFLSEKRLFFREGEEMMQMSNRLYYSRRFTDIQAGGKVSGQFNGNNFVAQDIYGDIHHKNNSYSGNTGVFRYLQNIGEKSTLGYYLADSELDEGHSRVLGMDGRFYITDDWKYRFQGAVADDQLRDQNGFMTKDRMDFLGHTTLEYERYPWEIDVNYEAITEGFDPVLGYIPRQNIFGPSFEIAYGYDSDTEWYRRLFFRFYTRLYENDNEETVLRDYHFDARVVLRNDLGLVLGHDDDYHAPYHNQRTVAGFTINESDYWRSLDFRWGVGEFEQVDYNEFSVGKQIKPIDRWPIRYDLVVRFEEESATQRKDTKWLNRIVFDYYFTDTMWLKTSLQQRKDSIHNVSVIYGWEFIHNAHWYMVFNSVDQGMTVETTNSIFSKIVYTF